MTTRELIDELEKFIRRSGLDPDAEVAVELDTQSTTWWGDIEKVEIEDGRPVIRAYAS